MQGHQPEVPCHTSWQLAATLSWSVENQPRLPRAHLQVLFTAPELIYFRVNPFRDRK